jgi:hypothetical protein
MKKALVFVTAFALVLVAGMAVALMGTPDGDTGEAAAVEEPTTTEAKEHEEPVDVVKSEEAPPEEEPEADRPQSEEEQPADQKESEETEEAKDTDPPDLVILHPEDGQHFETREVVFEGKTEPGASVFAGEYEADVDELGNWRIVLLLTNDGWNKATLSAKDAAGNESTASVKAYYEAPAEEAPSEEAKEEPSEHEFTASQKFGTCSEEPPYDVWYGTGEPGTKIWIGSEFGSGSTTIGEMGKWDLKVKFFEAPCNETIQVVLETDKGHRKVYEFERICEDGGGEPDK